MVKGLNKVFKDVVNEPRNEFPTFVESVSEVSHFVPEPMKFAEVTRLSSDVKKAWLKANLKYIKKLINNHTFILDDTEKGDPVTPCMDVY